MSQFSPEDIRAWTSRIGLLLLLSLSVWLSATSTYVAEEVTRIMINFGLFAACFVMSWSLWWGLVQPSTRRKKAAIFLGVFLSSLVAAAAAQEQMGAMIIFATFASPHITTALYFLAEQADISEIARQLPSAGVEEASAREQRLSTGA